MKTLGQSTAHLLITGTFALPISQFIPPFWQGESRHSRYQPTLLSYVGLPLRLSKFPALLMETILNADSPEKVVRYFPTL